MNVTDLAVGPDGALYFTMGGRGTQGGVYRIRWLTGRTRRQRPRSTPGGLEQWPGRATGEVL